MNKMEKIHFDIYSHHKQNKKYIKWSTQLSYTGCFTDNAVLDYAWLVIFEDFVLTRTDSELLGINSKIVRKYTRCLRKVVGIQHMFVLMGQPVFGLRLGKNSEIYRLWDIFLEFEHLKKLQNFDINEFGV